MDAAPPPPSSRLNKEASASLFGDILYGADEIAEFMRGKKKFRRSIYNLVRADRIPYFRIGNTICARRSVLLAWIAEQERPMNRR
ncbi:helix-turn-helix domain-containing protein [Bradyrhizobium sp. S69]|uniref:helix-turn-helix domain-containing protein n=1 Tax=Bradyrhizobium sp. S69 TaxID=1641856 RepID=UPI00131B7CCF|nr:helix-turn-helix domain-containing protein [Bradyrhizobium sp. S69]